MATYTRKQSTVEARQHFGTNLQVSSALKGEQTCLSGDFLVIDPIAVAAIRARELAEDAPENSLGNKGTVYVVSKGQFLADFDAKNETPAAVADVALDVNAVEPAPEA
jgi:hypothetical protein